MNVKQLIHDIIPYYAYIILGIIVCIIIYKLYKNDSQNQGQYNNIETFESVLNKLNTKKGKGKNNNNSDNSDKSDNSDSKKNKIFNDYFKSKSSKFSNTGTTFDDLLKQTEKMDPDKYTLANMRKTISDYNNSFKKEKFKNNSKNTSESLEKFSLYKEKFFEIFK
uniref:Uncharacterized protein n=1 Tax=viral metagenome TaxID=1070528 RepID=A0A6C0EYL0_9ZZZZ